MNINYNKKITLVDVAEIAMRPESSFSRVFKKQTGKPFTDCLNEIRIGHASGMLTETTTTTTTTIAEIAYKCGFSNISNLNRIFKPKNFAFQVSFEQFIRVADLSFGVALSSN